MRFFIFFCIAVLSGCTSNGHFTRIQQPKDAFSGSNAPVVFEGIVTERLRSPRIWCGVLATFQGVRYRVDKVTSGLMEPGERVVYHALVGPPLCEQDEAILSRSIFRLGQRLRVVGERTPSGEFVAWEQAENVRILR